VKTARELLEGAQDRFNRERHGADWRRIHFSDDQLRLPTSLLDVLRKKGE
jgi:hypothetical protein